MAPSSPPRRSVAITTDVAPVTPGASLLLAWQVRGKRVLIVGAGNVALSRITRVLESEARVTVIAPSAHEHVQVYAQRSDLIWLPRVYRSEDLEEILPEIVMVAINDHQVSRDIAEACRARKIPVNIADVPPLCDFYFMSEHRDGPLQVAVSTNGHGPALAVRVRRHIQSSLPVGTGEAIEKMGVLRQRLRQVDDDPDHAHRRMPWMSYICKEWPMERLAAMSEDQMERLVTSYQQADPTSPPPPPAPHAFGEKKGELYLMGAGLGDPDLLTVKAHRILTSEAELVISDRLISDEILALVHCELRIARKVPGSASSAQEELNAWGLEGLRQGKVVVRLKSGDPFLYGRAGEEMIFYRHHGYEPRVVPGLSSALSPSLAGVPLTHRGVANQVLILSAHNLRGAYPHIPPYYEGRTLVLLMGVGRLAKITELLHQEGYPDALDVLILENASHVHERQLFGTLQTIVKLAETHQVQSPATIVIGRAVRCLSSSSSSYE